MDVPEKFANLVRRVDFKRKMSSLNNSISSESISASLGDVELEESAAYRKPAAMRYWKHTKSLEGVRNAARAWHT